MVVSVVYASDMGCLNHAEYFINRPERLAVAAPAKATLRRGSKKETACKVRRVPLECDTHSMPRMFIRLGQADVTDGSARVTNAPGKAKNGSWEGSPC
jgi:hypothetical protein